MKAKWYQRKDETLVYKVGNYRVLEISKRPHKGYCCIVLYKGGIIGSNGYFTASLPKPYLAVRWGINKAKEFKIIL